MPLARNGLAAVMRPPVLLAIGALAACGSTVTGDAAEAPDFSALEAEISNGAFPKTTGVLVRQGDETVYEGYFGDGAPERLNDTRSATKTLVALALGAAIDEGHVASVDAPVWPLFADIAPDVSDRAKEITYRDLLTMTSSRHCDDNNDTPGNEDRMHETENWKAFFWSLPDSPGWSRAEDGIGPWRYCTAGSFMLGQAIERASGTPIDRYIETRVLAPLGVTKVEWFRSRGGEVQTGGGTELTLRDLGKVVQLIRDRGEWRGEQVLPAAWIDEMTTARRLAFNDMSYGYQIWTRPFETPCGTFSPWFMAGNGGNHALAFREQDLAIIVTREFYNSRGMHDQTTDMVTRLILTPLVCGAGN